MAAKRFWELPPDLEDFLLRHYVTLTKQLQVEAVMPYLIQEKILSLEDKQQIMTHTTSQGQAQALLDKVITRHTCTATLFVDVLRRSGQGHLADMCVEGEPNSKVARTEGYEDMTDAQLDELKGRLEKVYREEVERHEGSTSLEGLMGYKMGDTEPFIQVRYNKGASRIKSELLRRAQDRFHSLSSFVVEGFLMAHRFQMGTAFAADWVGDKKVTSDFKHMFKLKLNKVRKDQTIKDAIFDQLLWDTNYNPSFSKESLWRYMEQTQEEILFVLEGLDRLSPFTSPEILQLIDKKLLPRAKVIVTVAEVNGG